MGRAQKEHYGSEKGYSLDSNPSEPTREIAPYQDILESVAEACWKVVEKVLLDEQEVESDG